MTPRILDLSLNLPGPYATWLLASQGAEVVKLEPPRGDPARFQKAFFDRVNAGKRSVVLDLRDPASRPALYSLIQWADVLVEGFRPGVMERLGAGPEVAHAINPRLVYCRISAYGQQGPLRSAPGHDLNLQAITGFCALEGDGTRPHATRLPIADLSTSLAAVASIRTALQGPRERCVLDLAMSDVLQDWTSVVESIDLAEPLDAAPRTAPGPLRPLATRAARRLARRLRREKLFALPQYGLYATADGWLAVGIVDEQRFWTAFAEAIGLSAREAGLSMAVRTLLGPVLGRRIARRLVTRSTADWLTTLEPLGLPVTPVTGPDTVPPELAARRPLPQTDRPAGEGPALGADTEAVLASLR